MIKNLSFWDGDGAERERLREVISSINDNDAWTTRLLENVRTLVEMDRLHDKQIAQLQTVIHTLMQVIVDRGLIESSALETRVELALRALEPPEPARSATHGGSPYRGGPPASSPQPETMVCATCASTVSREGSFITEYGEVCATCAYTRHK